MCKNTLELPAYNLCKQVLYLPERINTLTELCIYVTKTAKHKCLLVNKAFVTFSIANGLCVNLIAAPFSKQGSHH